MDYEVIITNYQDKFEEEVGKIAITAWTPIREVAKVDLGDEIYQKVFNNWQEVKKNSIINSMKTHDGQVALINGKVVGFISYVVHGEVGEILENAVDTSYKGRGIAQKLYQCVLDKMKEQGAEIATVLTGLDEGHAPARRAYEKIGFEKNLKHITYYKKL